jgi:low affinity Fe/Cu permease
MSDDTYDRIELFASKVVRWATHSHVLLAIIVLMTGWAIFGPSDRFSSEWQSAMTVPATAITFLLVFLILRAQNKDTRAIQLKLNEIIAVLNGANNELIDIENMSEKTLEAVHQRYEVVAAAVKDEDSDVGQTETIIVQDLVNEVETHKNEVTRLDAAHR